MDTVHEIILLFSKYPIAGKSKTRLIPALGPDKAAALQRHMTESMAAKIYRFQEQRHCAFEIHYEGGTSEAMEQWLGPHYKYRRQADGDLGMRMYNSFAALLGRYGSIVLVGSDCPAVDGTILKAALEALHDNNIVLGPAYDGGYYLIGVRGDIPQTSLSALFEGIQWGTGEVLATTLERIHSQQLNYQLISKLHDIDTPEDLGYLDHHPDD